MATYDLTQSGGVSTTAGPYGMYWRKIHLDFGANPYSAADVLQLIDVPAGTFVLNVFTKVTTAEGATGTGDVGDGGDPNGWNDALDLNATGIEYGAIGTDARAITDTYLYSSADTIDLTLDHDIDTAVVDVAVLCYNPF